MQSPNLVYFINDRCTCAYDQYCINTHTITELIYIISGEGNARIEDTVYSFSKGDFYVINCYVSHSEFLKKNCNQSFEYFIIGVNNFYIDAEKTPAKPIKLSDDDKIVKTIYEIYDELNNKKNNVENIVKCQFNLLIEYILRKYDTKNIFAEDVFSSDIVGKVKHYIDSNYAANISSKTIADEFNCNQNTLSRKFKKQTNMSIQQYILLKKIELAKKMIATDNISITSLAIYCGFNDAAYFCKYFKKIVGISPSLYRKKLNLN